MRYLAGEKPKTGSNQMILVLCSVCWLARQLAASAPPDAVLPLSTSRSSMCDMSSLAYYPYYRAIQWISSSNCCCCCCCHISMEDNQLLWHHDGQDEADPPPPSCLAHCHRSSAGCRTARASQQWRESAERAVRALENDSNPAARFDSSKFC